MDAESIIIEVLVIVCLIIANGLFAISELAIVSSRKARLERRAEEGDDRARVVLELINDPNRMLSTVQVGITLISIFTGAFGGATLAAVLAAQFKAVPLLAKYSDVLGLAVVVTMITYISLVIGELVPKRIALNNPEPIACAVARSVRFFAGITSPLVRLLSISTEFIVKLLGVRKSVEPPVTEEEIKILVEQGTQYGTVEEVERDMVDRIFRLDNIRVSSVMTPRTQIDWLDLEDSEANNLRVIIESNHSRFPVGRGSLDDLMGVVYIKDLLVRQLVSSEPLNFEDHICSPLFVPKNMRALKLLEMFKQSRTHIALVLDEYGGVLGLVTLNDIVEEIVGEISVLDEPDEPQIVKRQDGSWLLDGMLPIEELKRLFELDELPGEGRELYNTLGGFIVSYLGHIPAVAQTFDWNGLRFEIVDMDRIRIDKVLVIKVSDKEN